MTDDPILAGVLAIVARVAGAPRTPPDAGPDTPLGEDGFWLDSVDLVEIVMTCEAEFGVVFDGERDLTPEAVATVRSLAALVRRTGGDHAHA